MQSDQPKTPLSAKIIFGIVIVAALWAIGSMIYSKAFNDGMLDERLRNEQARSDEIEQAEKSKATKEYIDSLPQ